MLCSYSLFILTLTAHFASAHTERTFPCLGQWTVSRYFHSSGLCGVNKLSQLQINSYLFSAPKNCLSQVIWLGGCIHLGKKRRDVLPEGSQALETELLLMEYHCILSSVQLPSTEQQMWCFWETIYRSDLPSCPFLCEAFGRYSYRLKRGLESEETQWSLTCNQILILVDLQLDTTKTFRGFCVDILNMWHNLKASVHLEK